MIRMKEDHFVKVRSMIKDMIAKLEADASAEADQKGWCDEEMSKATNQRDENIGHIEGDTASKTQADAKAIKLGEEIQTLMQEIAEAKKGLSEATNLRSAEKAENAKTVEDATAGLAGVTKALGILKDFYDNAFVQTGSQYTPPNAGADGQTVGDMAPDTGFSNDDYSGNQDAASGILGMLEVIKSDFERTIDTTQRGSSRTSRRRRRQTFRTRSPSSIPRSRTRRRSSATRQMQRTTSRTTRTSRRRPWRSSASSSPPAWTRGRTTRRRSRAGSRRSSRSRTPTSSWTRCGEWGP